MRMFLAVVALLGLAAACWPLDGGATPGSVQESGTLKTRSSAARGAVKTSSDTAPGVVLEITETVGTQLTLVTRTALEASSVELELSPAESESWTVVRSGWERQQSGTDWTTIFNTEAVHAGVYDVRAVVIGTSGEEHASAPLRDQLFANETPVVALKLLDPATKGTNLLAGGVTLEAQPQGTSPSELGTVNFQVAADSAPKREWETIGTLPTAPYKLSFDTSELPDGTYDFRAIPGSEAGRFVSLPVRQRLIDNTPPSVRLLKPAAGQQVSGRVTVSAEAEDTGAGVASVTFERAPAGSEAWARVGEATVPPYTHAFNTETVANGSYDVRATAIDRAGNRGTSPVVASVVVSNPQRQVQVAASTTGVVAPAEDVTMLGAVAGSAQHETWAYGFTSAPAAEVKGHPLPYTAEGKQLVLLRYTDEGGWQIADVLRNGDGSAFRLLPADQVSSGVGGVHVVAAMAPSGEAWLWLAETSTSGEEVFGLFRRSPGGPFELDDAAGQADQLGPGLLASLGPSPLNAQLRLGQTPDGRVYGILANDRAEYGLLRTDGTWTREVAPGGMTLRSGDADGPGEAWGAFEAGDPRGRGLILGHLHAGQWSFSQNGVGLDALDLTGALASKESSVEPRALKADGAGVWVEAAVKLAGHEAKRVVARYEGSSVNGPLSGAITNSWCTLPVANACEEPLDLDHPAAVPDAIFQTSEGPVALALRAEAESGAEAVEVFERGTWKSVATPGHHPALPDIPGGADTFTDPNHGWLGGVTALAHWSPTGEASSSLAPWPLPDRSTLTAVALPPGGRAEVGEAGAVAVGLKGTTLSYNPSTGWLVQPVPRRAQLLNLTGVAFAGPSSAFAVGQFGVILHWDGTRWAEDPQSVSLTQSQLNAVAFAPSGGGWAVGANGTILHYDGHEWCAEQPPTADSGADITSVTVAGSEVFAVAGGNLIERAGGTSANCGSSWEDATALLPANPSPAPEALRLLAGLPDGGLVAAGRSVLLVRETGGQTLTYAAQPLQGIAVALAPFRGADGRLRAYVSIAPHASGLTDVAGFPAGDGELLRESGDGWQDLSAAQFAGSEIRGSDGAVKSDPVLAVATDAAGERAWAVGGYAGTQDAAEQGTTEPLQNRPGWESASIWRYDKSGSTPAARLQAATVSPVAKPSTVSFAFFSSPVCKVECSAVVGAQPDVNLKAAAGQISNYASQPGGPVFAILGGNARGPVEESAYQHGNGAVDFAHLPQLLASFGRLPMFAALGKRDYVPGQDDETRPWSEAFAGAPAPFGSGPAAPGVAPVSVGARTPDGDVHRYYAFDAHQNGGTLRVIVLDNSKRSLEASSPGQVAWLRQQLDEARSSDLPVVAVTALPLHNPPPEGVNAASDGETTASMLASAGVLAVFTTNPAQLDEMHLVPEHAAGGPQIPEYEGASLGYQQSGNNGVKWYFVSVDTANRQVHVEAVPVVDSLSLKPVDGLSAGRSLTLRFEAIGRRPSGTLASRAGESPPFPGYDNYVEIPAPGCGSRPCVQPAYSFASSDPTVGDFVEPAAAGSSFPKLEAHGHPIPSSASGLFCAYNAGTTTVSVTAGLVTYSLPVTVAAGNPGPPCGTVPRAGAGTVQVIHRSQSQSAVRPAAAPPPPPAAAPLSGISPALTPVPPPPAPAPSPAVPVPQALPPPARSAPAAPSEPLPPVPIEPFALTPAIVPPAIPPVEPVPPGSGGFAQSPSAAKRREEVRKHARQSAFVVRPAGTRGADWFYAGVAAATLLTLLLCARAMPPASGARPALLPEPSADEGRSRRRRGRLPR